MKKVVLSILVLCFLPTASAFAADYAVDKGSTLLSALFSFSRQSGELYEDREGNSLFSFSIAPSVLHFVAPKFAVGGDMALNRVWHADVYSSTALAIGPKVAYFVGGPDSKAYPYLGVGFNYLRYSSDVDEYDHYGHTVTGTRFKVDGGVAVLLNSHLALMVEAEYFLDSLERESGESESGAIFVVGAGLAGFLFRE